MEIETNNNNNNTANETRDFYIVKTEDENTFEVSKEKLLFFKTIRDMLEDLKDYNGEAPIELVNVSGETFTNILSWVDNQTLSMEELKKIRDEEVEKSTKKKAYLNESDIKFFNGWSYEKIAKFINAVNFMEIPYLYDVSCAAVAQNFILGKLPHEIREAMHIEKDLTPEDEDKIAEENGWARPINSQQ